MDIEQLERDLRFLENPAQGDFVIRLARMRKVVEGARELLGKHKKLLGEYEKLEGKKVNNIPGLTIGEITKQMSDIWKSQYSISKQYPALCHTIITCTKNRTEPNLVYNPLTDSLEEATDSLEEAPAKLP